MNNAIGPKLYGVTADGVLSFRPFAEFQFAELPVWSGLGSGIGL